MSETVLLDRRPVHVDARLYSPAWGWLQISEVSTSTLPQRAPRSFLRGLDASGEERCFGFDGVDLACEDTRLFWDAPPAITFARKPRVGYRWVAVVGGQYVVTERHYSNKNALVHGDAAIPDGVPYHLVQPIDETAAPLPSEAP